VIGGGLATLLRAREEAWAIPAFSIYNLEQALAVCAAAEQEGLPALVQAGSSAFGYAGREPLAALALAAAEASSAEIGVHLDHATDVDEIRFCLERGYTSVMYDGSALPLRENIARTREVVAAAAAHGAWVEGELAGFAGNEDESLPSGAATELTDPDDAARFVEETGVAALAVAIGNVHGIPTAPVRLDLDRLAAIHDRVEVPLVLHGASGLPAEEVNDAIALGVAKLNVNTELRRAFRAALLALGADPPSGDGFARLLGPALDAVRDAAAEKLRVFGPNGGRTADRRLS